MKPRHQVATDESTNGAPPASLWARALAWGFIVFGALACVDRPLPLMPNVGFETLFVWWGLGLMGLLVAFDFAAGQRARARWGPRLALTFGAWLLTLALAYQFRHATDFVKTREVVERTFRAPATWLLIPAWWLAAPLLWRRADDGSGAQGSGAAPLGRALRVTAWLLMIYLALCYASAVGSRRPSGSLRFVLGDRVIPLAVLMAWARLAARDARFFAPVIRRVLLWLAALLGASLLFGILFWIGAPPLRAELAARGLVFFDLIGDHRMPAARLLFPAEHFNRTAWLALLALGWLLVSVSAHWPRASASALGRRADGLALRLLGIPAALCVIVFSYTRGAVVGAIVMLAAWSALVSRRVLLALIAAGVIGFMLLPAPQRSHYLSIFRASTYRPIIEQTQPGAARRDQISTSMEQRLLAWHWALDQAPSHLMTGWGYGYRVTRSLYLRDQRSEHGNPRVRTQMLAGHELQHLHNIWLETLFESGLLTLAAFAAFCGWRWWLLAAALRRSGTATVTGLPRARIAAWIGLEAALLVFGMLFYMLKENIGALAWMTWMAQVVDLERGRADAGAGECADAHARGGVALDASEPAPVSPQVEP